MTWGDLGRALTFPPMMLNNQFLGQLYVWSLLFFPLGEIIETLWTFPLQQTSPLHHPPETPQTSKTKYYRGVSKGGPQSVPYCPERRAPVFTFVPSPPLPPRRLKQTDHTHTTAFPFRGKLTGIRSEVSVLDFPIDLESNRHSSNQSKKGKYNPISVWFDKISKRFLTCSFQIDRNWLKCPRFSIDSKPNGMPFLVYNHNENFYHDLIPFNLKWNENVSFLCTYWQNKILIFMSFQNDWYWIEGALKPIGNIFQLEGFHEGSKLSLMMPRGARLSFRSKRKSKFASFISKSKSSFRSKRNTFASKT